MIIIFAGTLTNLDASAASPIDRLTAEIKDTQQQIAAAIEASSWLTQPKSDDASVQNLLLARAAALRVVHPTVPLDIQSIAPFVEQEKAHLALTESLLSDAWKKELSAEKGYNDTRYIVASSITRVGVIVVIVFLVQILIGLFRYNSRLITFYNARRDFLQLWDGKVASIKGLEQITAPNIDIGKEPKHPLEEILKRLRGHREEHSTTPPKADENDAAC